MTRTLRTRISLHKVVQHIGTRDETLQGLRDEGLFEAEELDSSEADDLRIATLLIEELGVNPAGVQVALHLRRRLVVLEARVNQFARQSRTGDPIDGSEDT